MSRIGFSQQVCAIVCLAGLLLIPAERLAAEGRLSGVAEAAQSGSGSASKKEQKSSSTSSRSCEEDSLGSLGTILFTRLFLVGATSPWWIPYLSVEHDNHPQAEFLSEVYSSHTPGRLTFEFIPDAPAKDWEIRLLADYGTDFSGLERTGGQFQYDTRSRWGLETSWNRFTEDLGSTTDALWLGDANLTYRFAQNEAIQFYTGAGLNWLHRNEQADFGFNFLYGAELYPVKPWIFRGVLDLGRIGSTSRIHFRGDVGLAWTNMEFLIGYDLERLSNINLQTFSAGLQIRF